MTTLGFGDMYANAHSLFRGIFGHILMALQVILGYVLLGALVTRFAVLFTAGGQAGNLQMKKKTKNNKQTGEKGIGDIHDEAFNAAERIIELTNTFCLNHLDEDYRELCEDLTWAAYEEGLPLEKGRPTSWAGGVVHAIGFINFLQDPSQLPHMTSAQIAEGFRVSQQTMQAKSKIIRDQFDLMQFDPDWCLPSLIGDNPLVWMLEVDGLIIDARTAPLEFQQEAHQLGLIPYIPGENLHQELEPQSGTGARIIEFPSGRNNTPASQPAQKTKDDGPSLFEEYEQ
jgi:hypothetical protein